ncbi:MAG: PAS domain-containing protein [Candidatus Brocadia sp. AMX2]|nr:MAG: PAS domain-containing protein [Candidatus Brocadia sp. AMX2]
MIASQVIFIFIFLLIAGIGVFVLLRNPANVINKRFCIFAHVVSVWIFFIFFLLQTTDTTLATFRLKLVFCAAVFIPPTFFSFSSVFPDRTERPIERYLSISFFIISTLLAFSSSHIVESVSFVRQFPQAKYSPLFPIFWFHFIVCMAYSLYIPYGKSRRFYGIKRLQIQYVYFGVAVSVFLGIITNFLLPVFGIWQVEMFVPLVSVPIPIAVAYAIVKYHLMDISVVIKKSTVYAILSIVLSIIYFTVGLVMSSILPVSKYTETVSNVISIIIIVFIFVPTRESIQHFIENRLFHTKYSYPKILSNSTVMFSSIHDLNRLLRFAIQYLYDSVGIEKIGILTKDENTKQYSLKAAINFSSEDGLFLPGDTAVVTWLCHNKTVLSREQLNRFTHGKLDRLLEETLVSMDVDSCIPILHGKDLFGIILLGKKVNKKVFTQEDIQMFLAFSGQLAMAANNARLYSGLEEAKTYRDNILQSLKCGVITINNHEEVTLSNKEAKSILGLESVNSSKMIFDVFDKETYKLLKHTLKNGKDHIDIETFIERGNNARVPCSVTITQLKTESGEKLGALMILTDQTELKLLQVEKQHADRLAHLGSLASNIAHEIKNPLVAINTYFQLLPYKKDDPEFHTNFREIALKEIGRINRIIEEMLNLAKPSKLVIQHIDPHCVIMDTINFLKNDAAKKDIKITTMLEGRRCQLIADEDKVKQVLINILQNSFDALPDNGHITVSTRLVDNLSEFKSMAKEQPGSIFFSFAPPLSNNLNKQYFVVKISDNGAGIPAEKIPYIFEPFFSNKDKGTGLGLAVVYRIIKDHEGGIYVESKEGVGTDFYIGLPLNNMGADSIINSRPKAIDTHLIL